MTDSRDAYIEHLENTIKGLQEQVTNLNKFVELLRKEKFGSKSEKTPVSEYDGQMSLFNEAESVSDPSAAEPVVKTVSGYVRRSPKTQREEIIKDLPVEEIPCTLPGEEQFCDRCHSKLRPVGKEIVREEIQYIPAQLKILRYVRYTYECPKCKHTEKPFFKKALTPTSLMNHSLASPSSVAYVMYQKYVNALPLYRQEKIWENMGLSLTRSTMANWIIRCSEDHLYPVIEHMRKKLTARDIIHCDETPVQVLKEDGKKPQTKSYMWLYRSGSDGRAPVVIYDYQPSRNGDNAANYLKDFKGFVHSDGYSGYNKLKGITRVGCWAHLRRKFVEAIPQHKSDDSLTMAEIGRNYCDRLFRIESELKGYSPEEKKQKRLELEKPVIDEFWNFVSGINVLPKSALGKAVTYALNQKPFMENYLLDGRCSISNNAAENAIRPFTVGRKNWLFSDTPKGAKASAAVYSIVETAKANGLNVYAYLERLLLYMPDCRWQEHPEELDELMPWSDMMQSECK